MFVTEHKVSAFDTVQYIACSIKISFSLTYNNGIIVDSPQATSFPLCRLNMLVF